MNFDWLKYWALLLLLGVVLLTLTIVAVVSSIQLPVIAYKIHLACLGILIAHVGNEMFLKIENEIAQAIIILAVIHGLTSAL